MLHGVDYVLLLFDLVCRDENSAALLRAVYAISDFGTIFVKQILVFGMLIFG
jgi:hypothetical protein